MALLRRCPAIASSSSYQPARCAVYSSATRALLHTSVASRQHELKARNPHRSAVYRPLSIGEDLDHHTSPDLVSNKHNKSPPLGDKQRFYNFYLNFQFTTGSRVGAWVRGIDTKEHREVLPANLQSNPADWQLDADTQLDHLRRALELFIAETGEHRERYSDLPGTRAMHWLLDVGAYDSLNLVLELRFTRALVHCIVAQGRSEDIWTWLEIKHTPSFASALVGTERGQWSQTVLQQLLHATAFWDGLDAATDCFTRCFALSRTYKAQGVDYNFSFSNLGYWLTRTISTQHRGKISPQKYVRLMRALPGVIKDPVERMYTASKLELHHPVSPTAGPAYDFIQNIDKHKRDSAWLCHLFSNPPGTTSLFAYTVTAAQVLQKEGRLTEAQELLDWGRENLPHHFAMKKYKLENRWFHDAPLRVQSTANHSDNLEAVARQRYEAVCEEDSNRMNVGFSKKR